MKVKTVSVCYGRKVNLGDFNSAHVECTIWADVDEEEQLELNRIMQDLWAMAKENVKGQVRPLSAVYGKFPGVELKEYFMGLPVRKETGNDTDQGSDGHSETTLAVTREAAQG